jgi:hypothetical protein
MTNQNLTIIKLDTWVKNNKNVLFKGKHGIGKTAIVKETFDRHKLNWLYFSASTMDPWVDFIGVPREKTEDKIPEQFEIIKELAKLDIKIANEWVQNNWKMSSESAHKIITHTLQRKQGLTYLDLIRPQNFANGEVEALFFDEYNRSPKKVRNAVMELIQFKSINGMKFPKLRIVWAAINPDDDENQVYDVEKIDPAQIDRFHVIHHLEYKPNKEWFINKYGEDLAESAIEWWEELPEEIQNNVSPRRLQYALDIYKENEGDIRDVLDFSSNVSKLNHYLTNGSTKKNLKKLIKSKNTDEAIAFLKNEDNYSSSLQHIANSKNLIGYFVPLMPKEKIAILMGSKEKEYSDIVDFIVHNLERVPVFKRVCSDIMTASSSGGIDKDLIKRIRTRLTESQVLGIDDSNINKIVEIKEKYFLYFSRFSDSDFSWEKTIKKLKEKPMKNSEIKMKIYDEIEKKIPNTQTAQEAIDTLELLNKIFIDSFASTLINSKSFANLTGIVNNCLTAIHKETNKDYNTIIIKYSSNFKELLAKINDAGLFDKIGIQI